ncbi:MAG: Eco57I restriction-modification methylase domain-containing protein [Treponema sp.]|nr:Eco57I restriction-modification methylase domain-containing protein [Treponema sp.]
MPDGKRLLKKFSNSYFSGGKNYGTGAYMFQKNIVEKYLSQLDKELLEQKYDLFCSIFKNETKIANIRAVKEEQYQEGFIRDVFCSILNYTIKPEPDYNILTELKNETKNKNNARKSDGAICEENNESRVRAVIELKGTDTTDLDTVARQAFDYKSHHENCNYAIVCNFERLRLYVETQIEFIEFNLFTLTFEDFCILYLLLELNQLKNDIPLKLKHETLSEEKQITDNFYADYSTFKRSLFEDMIEKNPQTDKLVLFKKTQKLLDRILFILFCEDRGLLPANSVMGIIGDYQKLKEMGYGQPLYSVFKTYFDRIDKGYKSESDSTKNIFAYNGGLFKPDETLDNLTVGDDVLFIHSKRLADYDFESQISVDILGRIFENSLTEIEEVQKEIEAEKTGEKVENNNVGKRKKDGVFYTPEYITKYIVENTIGKLCEEKREELKINDEEFTPEKSVKTGDDKKTVATKQKITAELDERLENYRKWLLDLKILDPACGSGAFLNAALQQLKIEHTLIDYYWSNIHAGELNFTEIENTILENNLYGVDINEESVEIAKLSLWLHTAKKNRKLTTLNGKIKCGNSLIDDSAIAGEKAFNWEKEFPEVFAKGGFDVVIGNPPYLRIQGIQENKDKDAIFYEQNYKSAIGRYDLYVLFMEKSFSLIKENGIVSFILPHKFLNAEFGQGIRQFIYDNKALKSILHFGASQVFADATVYTCIIQLSHNNASFAFAEGNPEKLNGNLNFDSFPFDKLSNTEKWTFQNSNNSKLIDKLNSQEFKLQDIYDYCSQGTVSMGDDIYLMKGHFESNYFIGYSTEIEQAVKIEKELMKPTLKGEDVKKYSTAQNQYWQIYPHYEKDGVTVPYEEDELKSKFPLCYEYLSQFKDILIEKKRKYKTNEKYWYSLHRAREIAMFNQTKIITPEISLGCNMTLDKNSLWHNTKVYTILLKDNFKENILTYLTILNSKLMWFFLSNTGYTLRGGYFTFKTKYLENFPIPDLTNSQFSTINSQLTSLADKMLTLNEAFQKKSSNFIKVVKQSFALEKVSVKLESFYELDFDGFVKELKQKITPKLKLEWLEVFEDTKKQLLDLKQQIDSTDKEINSLVYQLYGLTDEEIAVVEGK